MSCDRFFNLYGQDCVDRVYFDYSLMGVKPTSIKKINKFFVNRQFSDMWKSIVSKLVYNGYLSNNNREKLAHLKLNDLMKLDRVIENMEFKDLDEQQQTRLNDFMMVYKRKIEILTLEGALE